MKQAVECLPLLDEVERHRVLVEWNATAADYPRDKCIHELFESQVERTPDAVAVEFEDRHLSYGELNARANRLAHHLRALGVKPDDRVAICVERSFEMIVGLLAILKAGGAYVPLDPAYPAERLAFMLRDSTPVALLTDTSSRGVLADCADGLSVLDLTTDVSLWVDYPANNLNRASIELTPEHLAYVIYTSGSTGRPKGVMVEHRGLQNLSHWYAQALGLSQDDNILIITSYSFDLTQKNIFGALITGGRLCLGEEPFDPEAIWAMVARKRITMMNLTPSAFDTLIDVWKDADRGAVLQRVVLGGEPIQVAKLLRLKTPKFEFINGYGPTESTAVAAWHRLASDLMEYQNRSIPIGRPISNTSIYILDPHQHPVPVGVSGEIYIGGAGVARGYLNRPDLTAERFVADPFAGESGARMYRTGDLGRWLADGNIEFLGRNDFQVKIRGFRIELGEIEARLAEYDGVREAVVIVREDGSGDKRLVAYYVGEEGLTAEALRGYLGAVLPDYMVPSAYVRLETLPLTPNGKLDRKALPAPEGDAYARRGYEAPVGEIEETVAAIWSELLGVERVGRYDNFFELGGHSLLAVTLIERLRQQGLQVDVRAVFATPTLAGLAAETAVGEGISVPPNLIPEGSSVITPEMLPLIELSQAEIDRIIASVPGGAANIQDIYPLTSLQEGFLFHHLMTENSDTYLMSSLLGFDSRNRLDSFLSTLEAVIARHDILRTGVMWECLSQAVQVVWRKAPLSVEEVIFDPAEGAVAEQLQVRFDSRCYRLDVRQAPMIRAFIAYDPVHEQWLLQLLRHHLVTDHTTLEVLVEEMAAYRLGQAERLTVSIPFRNFAAQSRFGVSIEEHEVFFREMLGDVDEPTLPFGLSGVQGDGSDIEEARVALDADLARRLRQQSRALGVSAASLFHVAWAQVLARTSGREDVVFGTVLFGRLQGGVGTDLAPGMFINTLPVRITVDDEGVEATVHVTHGVLAGLLRHEHASLALTQRCSQVPAPLPLFSALLNYRHNQQTVDEATSSAWEGIEVLGMEYRTNYPFTLSVDDLGEGFSLTAQVLSGVGAERVCGFMCTALTSLVEALETAPAMAVRHLEILSAPERHRVLVEWNATAADYPRDKCIHELFEAQVERTPDAVAVEFEDQHLSYGELNARANRLAHHLRALGVKPDDRVAICVEPSFEMIVGLLGVLKAGGAYVPLDPAYPVERLAFMLRDSTPVALLTDTSSRGVLADCADGLSVLDLTTDVSLWVDYPANNLNHASIELTPEHLAYVIYTSGSTGMPKGVMVEHENVARLFAATNDRFGFNETDVWSLFHSYAFDFSVWEIWGALLHGSRLVIVSQLATRSPQEFYHLLCRTNITVLNQTPSAFRQLIGVQTNLEAHRLRYVIFGGEALDPRILKPWYERDCNSSTQLVNMYGITETTVHVTYKLLQQTDTSSHCSLIGCQIPDLKVYILDPHQQPVPVGVAGELYIGGAGVARGYLNRPDLTAERFVADPFAGESGARMYRTGDLGRWLADGNIEFLGRNDFQVKIRGFRIELGEIEARLAEYDGVREAVVIAREDGSGDKRLVAYVVLNANSLDAIRERFLESAHRKRAEEWESIFDDTYYVAKDNLSFEGWNSSYTGNPIPNEEMKEWLSGTVEQIRKLQPKRVLEIGCGSGLILQQLAPHCDKYCGTDVSNASIAFLRGWLSNQDKLQHVEVKQLEAIGVSKIYNDIFDTVILNSVVQYFPDAIYLRSVLESAVKLVSAGGCVFVGDIRHYGLLEVFHAATQFLRAPQDLSVGQLKRNVARALEYEKELVIDPQFFVELEKHIPRISRVEILLKRGQAVNELTRYRYDVVLHVEETPTPIVEEIETLEFDDSTLSKLVVCMSERRPVSVWICNVPNCRLARDLTCKELLETGQEHQILSELTNLLEGRAVVGQDPETFWMLGEVYGYDVRISWTPSSQEGHFDVLITDRFLARSVKTRVYDNNNVKPSAIGNYINDPLEISFRQNIVRQLKEDLQTNLPDYMVPSAYVILDALPLTPNGKLDRKALSAPDDDAYVRRGYEAPIGETEETLAAIWSELLGVERVGRYDNFFELGGHSLLAVILIERLRQKGLQVDVRAVFTTPTLVGLSAAVVVGEGIIVPPNLIPDGSPAITPEMLPLIDLSQVEIDHIVAFVPGGAANIQDIYPLTPTQEGFLFHHLITENGDAYLMLNLTAFDSRSRLDGLLSTLEAVIARHDVLRTGVMWEGLSQPVQVVWRNAPLPVEEIVLDPAAGGIAEQLQARFASWCYRLDVRQAPMIRASVAYDPVHERWLLQLLYHHLVVDHTTLEVLAEEMAVHRLGQADRLMTSVPFRNFVPQARFGVSIEEHEAFFREMLGDVDEPTLPFGLSDVRGYGSDIEEVRVALDADLARRLRQQARILGVSATSLFHVAWAQVLARTSRRDDVVFGTVLFGRLQGGTGADATGMFINTLPVRIAVGDEGVAACVRRVHALLATLLRHEHASLALAQRCSQVPAPLPLFSAIFNYRHNRQMIDEATSSAWEGIEMLAGEERDNYPLTLSVNDLAEGFELKAHVLSGVGAERVCGFMCTALTSLVEALETAPAMAVRHLEILSAPERHRVLVEWNDTTADYPRDKCIHELFEAQVERTLDAVAVEFEDRHLSYGELNARANRLAHHLRALGVKPDDRVAICVERSFEMVIGLLAVLKAGGAYVPLDPAYPAERLAFMLGDSAPVVVLTDTTSRGVLADCADDLPVLDLTADASLWADYPATNPERASIGLTSEHLAYVIYTSGSTGTPKGVMVEHCSLCNLVHWYCIAFELKESDRSSCMAAVAFDAAGWEIWPSLCAGSVLVLSPVSASNPEALIAWWMDRPLDVTYLPTPMAEFVFAHRAENPHLRTLLVGGDRLRHRPHLRGLSLVNNYGPTETTIVVTSGRMLASDTVLHIGRPIANTSIYILDTHGQPVPVGVAGELYIGGAGVARGYLNRPDLTAKRFVADPFAGELGARMYRTGDLGRWLADGNIEFLGRNDFQVKIRGFRIELGEIEARLSEHADIREAVVIAREDGSNDKRLVAYYVGEEGLTAEALRGYLGAVLPDYMVPSAYVQLEVMPLTPNGKLDRKALPAPDGDAYARRGYEAPVGEIEETVAAIWSELLGVERVGRHDNFFELGGHSLLAMTLISRLRQVLDVEMPLAALFAHPVLADFASGIVHALPSVLPPIVPADRSEPLPLSFAQQRLWFLAQFEGGSSAYHIPGGIKLSGHLDRDVLRRACDRIVARHENLRMRFAMVDGHPVQHIAADDVGFALVEHDLRDATDVDAALRTLAEHEARSSFDLETGPLIRGRLVRLGTEEHVLLVTMHHIVSDGWSIGVLINELSALYGAFVKGEDDPLPPLTVQYADYAVWQRNWLEGTAGEEQATYWKETLAGAPELLSLPTDYPRPAHQDYAGAAIGVRLDADLSRRLKALSQRHGVTLYMTLLASWVAVLSRLSGQDDVVIGSPTANRSRIELECLIGFFVNTLALRVDVSGSPTVGELLRRVKAVSLGAQSHQDIPFEQVVELVQPTRSLSHAPLFQVMFAWQNTPQGSLELPGLRLSAVGSEHVTAQFDLSLSLGEADDEIAGSLDYATSLFERATVERYLGYWRRLLEGIVADDSQAVERLPLLDEAERHRVLVEWNDTTADYPRDKCIHELFEAQVERTLDAVAVEFEDRHLSYGELNARANRLAHHLRALGVKPDDRVAICVERSFEMVIGLLAVLKAGGAYVPLDPAYPAERLAFMLGDSAPVVVLTDTTSRGVLADCADDLPVIDLTADASLWAAYPATNPDRASIELTPEHLAYVIYTSGSTGMPKGVMVEHRSLCQQIAALKAKYGLNYKDRVLQFATVTFDASLEEVFGSLFSGGSLVLRTDAWLSTAHEFWELCKRYRLSIVSLPTLFWQQISGDVAIDIPATLRLIIIGGETVSALSLSTWFGHTSYRPNLLNSYGPTETTVNATIYKLVNGDNHRCIGRPISNTSIYILDSHQQPVPVGVSGELYIGGAGVARGYLNRPDLTAERFVADPFAGGPGARMYRTGDLGRWLADGNIEFLGRNDFQVKIRGFRIELGEIEARLVEHADIREAVVIAREDGGNDKRLVAYYVGEEGLTAETLRVHLGAVLPDYMVPSAYVRLETLPLTPNGKLDRKALPTPEGDAYARRGYEAPVGEIETMLATIWSELLGVERVGRHDNFFELGGHSLLAVQLVSLARQKGVETSLTKLFAHPTIEALAYNGASQNNILSTSGAVLLRTEGKQPPLFLVPEISGEILYTRGLVSHLALGFPVYGLSLYPANEVPFRTVEVMATRLRHIIRTIQPEGPYRIAGWSFGGKIAYEITAQLVGEDETVQFVGLIDSYYSGHSVSQKESDEVMLRQIILSRQPSKDQLIALDAATDFVSLVHKSQELSLLPKNITIAEVHQYIHRLRHHADANEQYLAHTLPVPIYLFSAQDNDAERKTRGWEQVVPPERLHIIPVSGDHYSMMEDPHIAQLGRAISTVIQRAQEYQASEVQNIDYSPLVTIQAAPFGTSPIFCIPGAGANAASFTDFACALGENWQVYALQPRGLDGQQVPHSTVPAAARAYLAALELSHPNGPVHLLGHSFGGWIAFEMASQLRASGRAVASLMIVDSEVPDRKQLREYNRTEALMEMVNLFEQAAGCSLQIKRSDMEVLDAKQQLELLLERLIEIRLMPRRAHAEILLGPVRTFETALRTNYQPTNIYPEPMGLVLVNDTTLSNEDNERNFQENVNGWQRIAPQLIPWRGPGNHMTVLKKPWANKLAEWLQQYSGVK